MLHCQNYSAIKGERNKENQTKRKCDKEKDI